MRFPLCSSVLTRSLILLDRLLPFLILLYTSHELDFLLTFCTPKFSFGANFVRSLPRCSAVLPSGALSVSIPVNTPPCFWATIPGILARGEGEALPETGSALDSRGVAIQLFSNYHHRRRLDSSESTFPTRGGINSALPLGQQKLTCMKDRFPPECRNSTRVGRPFISSRLFPHA